MTSGFKCPWLAQGKLTFVATKNAARYSILPRFPAAAPPPPGNEGDRAIMGIVCSSERETPPGKPGASCRPLAPAILAARAGSQGKSLPKREAWGASLSQ